MRNRNLIVCSFLFPLLIACLGSCASQSEKGLVNREVWTDTEGNVINAHGGGLLFHDGTWYWYGEYKGDTTIRLEYVKTWECWRTEAGGVSCYSSADLLHWKFEGVVLPPDTTGPAGDLHPSQVIERPKVIYNKHTGKFVMWMHIENPEYEKAHAGVAVSDSPTGPFTYLGSFKPNGMDSRDQTIFLDDDGKAYQIASTDWNKSLCISLLDSSYTKPSGVYSLALVGESREAPAVVRYGEKYYMLTSGCTGWDANAARYAVADSMLGEWTLYGNPCLGEGSDSTFGAQGTYIFRINSNPDRYVAMFDQWNKRDLYNSGYLWLPVCFSEGRMEIPFSDTWTVGSTK